ncbi:MAG: TIGR03960 family B12-binding radical SAM protein [Candidatus Aminicenantaceae bacterium]
MKNLEEILKEVEKPGRYLGGDWNEVRKNPKSVRTKVALVFPDVYEIGMSYLGQKILYSLLNDRDSILAERVFAPWIDFEQKLRSRNIPLYSLENKIPIAQFDILGFSLLYELNYSNVLTILDLGRIPFFSSERGMEYPLVIAGGPAVFNPEPVADFFDLFLIGDGEDAFLEIIERYMILKKEVMEKSALLKEMAKIKGVYVPSLYSPYNPPASFLLAVKPDQGAPEKIKKRVFLSFFKAPFPENIVVPNIKVVFDRVAIEVARGCPQKCRFCQASNIYFPPRIKSPSLVLKNVLNSLRSTGYEDSSLASLSISDYPYLDKTIKILMEELVKQKVSLSLSSLRPKGLSPEVVSDITRVRKTGFTLVPEAGTERLRQVINKNLEDKMILEASQNAFSQGWRLLKLYFMVGLPTEKDEDLEGIARLVEKIVGIGYRVLKSAPRINLSVSSFIPKPHTPFQWLKLEDESILREKHKFLKSRLKKYPSVKFKSNSIKNSILEAVFSRGDRKLNQVLHKSWKEGARFDSWNELFDFRFWDKGFGEEGINYHLYLSFLERESVLPWDHIDTGIKKSFLLNEFDKAFKEEQTLSCLESQCALCEGCTLPSLLERKFQEKIKIPKTVSPSFGKKTENVFRYRVFYSKLKSTRFISHVDLINVLQRTLRRAGISTVFSEGFHPKMLITYPSALPLGMEGKAECFEFKSNFLYIEKEFVPHVNKFLPSGIKLLSLKRLKTFKPSLNEEIRTLVYSIDLKDRKIKEAVEMTAKEINVISLGYYERIEKLIEKFLAKGLNELIEKVFINRKRGRLFIYIKHDPQKNIRSQEIFENILGIKELVFLMAREEIIFNKEV